jgi:hypothetical protein
MSELLKTLRSEVLMAVKMLMVVFQVVTPCGLIDGYQCLGGTLKMEAIHSSEMFVTTYKAIWHHNPEDHHQHPYNL